MTEQKDSRSRDFLLGVFFVFVGALMVTFVVVSWWKGNLFLSPLLGILGAGLGILLMVGGVRTTVQALCIKRE